MSEKKLAYDFFNTPEGIRSQKIFDMRDRIRRLEASNAELLAALESICTEISGGLCMNYTGATGICPNAAKGQCAVWDAIQKAKGTQQ